MYTEFTPSKTKTTYGITYLGGGDVKDPYQDKFAEVVMSNYIIPSIEPLMKKHPVKPYCSGFCV